MKTRCVDLRELSTYGVTGGQENRTLYLLVVPDRTMSIGNRKRKVCVLKNLVLVVCSGETLVLPSSVFVLGSISTNLSIACNRFCVLRFVGEEDQLYTDNEETVIIEIDKSSDGTDHFNNFMGQRRRIVVV